MLLDAEATTLLFYIFLSSLYLLSLPDAWLRYTALFYFLACDHPILHWQ